MAGIDAYKKQSIGNLVTGQNTINVPAKTLFVKGVQVYDSTSTSTGNNTWLEKKDESYLQEYQPSTESAARAKPKYYAMFVQMDYLALMLQLILVSILEMVYYMLV
jgi:hypothetical protein